METTKPFQYHRRHFIVTNHHQVGTSHVQATVQELDETTGIASGRTASAVGGFAEPRYFTYSTALGAAREVASMNLIKAKGGNPV